MTLKDIINLDNEIIIFGTGQMAKTIGKEINNIIFFIDNDKKKWGTLFLEKSVYSPFILKEQRNSKAIIVIASIYYNAIALQLENMGLKYNKDFIDGRTLYEEIIELRSRLRPKAYSQDTCPVYKENMQKNRKCLLNKEFHEMNAFIQSMYKNILNKSEKYIEYDENFNINLQNDDAKIITFYLPQFHTIPENDKYWGKGFTEWTNVTRALPLFEGHNQPQLPIDLGFYNLNNVNVMRRQVELAKQYGIYGFCFYYYWFMGKRLLELPIENFLKNKDINFKYCLCWANESWTKKWDGEENEVIIKQNYSTEDDIKFIQGMEKFFKDDRYIRINNKPVLLVYKAQSLPNPQATVKRWRKYCMDKGIGEIYLIACQAFRFDNPTVFGFDAAVEFPPNNIYDFKLINDKVKIYNDEYKGRIIDLQSWILSNKHIKIPMCKTFKTAFPAWDNTARRPNDSTIYCSNPSLYKTWLKDNIIWTRNHMSYNERFVFVNAWNEWGEGAHLEPDKTYGYANLMATSEAILEARYEIKRKIIFISYDTGDEKSTILNFNILRYLKKMFYYDIEIINLTQEESTKKCIYNKYGNVFTISASDKNLVEKLNFHIKGLYKRGFSKAICNLKNCFDFKQIFLSNNIREIYLLNNEIEKDDLRKIRVKNSILDNLKNFNEINKIFKDFIYELLDALGDKYKKLSVVIPNYNYGNYIKERIQSIINQLYPIYELIVLDDCSQDNSVKIIEETLNNIKNSEYRIIDYKVIVNSENSGSAFKQWIKGLKEVHGEYVWIAEADDLCNRNFLEKVIKMFDIDPNIVLAYSQSKQMDNNGDILCDDYCNYTDDIDTLKWKNNYVCDGIDEIRNTLAIKNTIPNISAVIFKKDYDSLDEVGKIEDFRVGGDLYFYVWILQKGKIAFCSESLNYNRIHSNSSSFDLQNYKEISWLQSYIINKFNVDENIEEKAYKYREKVKILLDSKD